MAHLMRRAGFGATRAEIERRVELGYEETVEELLDPGSQPEVDESILFRYHPMAEYPSTIVQGQVWWLYHLVHTRRPLQEKVALFWHQVFATGHSKVESAKELIHQIEMFREHGMGNYRDLLIRLAQNPAMIFWLDNNENHKRAPNENWGRELLELFSMGAGNYTEKDVLECSRAFTGWTMGNKIPFHPWGPFLWQFEYHTEDHDSGEKTFLGQTGRFNGEDIVNIIVQHPATAKFIARHLYSFFVADEPQVPAWPTVPPMDGEAVKLIAETLAGSGLEITPVLRTIFNADFFKTAMYKKVKSPIEVVVGTQKLTRDMEGPHPGWPLLVMEPARMGQAIYDPPTVEGWHTGKEWIDSGAFVKRVNFVSERVKNTEFPGVRDIIERVAANGAAMTAEVLVDRCLDQMGPPEVEEKTRRELVEHAESEGPISWGTQEEYATFSRRVGEMLALIAGTREYQFC